MCISMNVVTILWLPIAARKYLQNIAWFIWNSYPETFQFLLVGFHVHWYAPNSLTLLPLFQSSHSRGRLTRLRFEGPVLHSDVTGLSLQQFSCYLEAFISFSVFRYLTVNSLGSSSCHQVWWLMAIKLQKTSYLWWSSDRVWSQEKRRCKEWQVSPQTLYF